MEEKKILFVTTVEITLRLFLLPFAEELAKKGWIVDCMANGANRCIEINDYFSKCWDIPFQRNLLGSLFYLTSLKRIQEIVSREDYDIVHVHTPVASFLARMALRKRKKPKMIYTAHGFHFHQEGSRITNRVFYLLEKIAANWTDYLITINDEDYECAVKNNMLPRNKILKISGIGIDTEYYSKERIEKKQLVDLRSKLNLLDSGTTFITIAEFNPGKRHIDLLKALSLIDRNDLSIIFVGTGKHEGYIKAEARRLNIIERIRFVGFRDDIPALLGISSAMVLPSIREGLPRSIMEGMSMEMPVIGTNIRGIRELLNGGSGILVPPKNPEVLAEAMKWIIENPEKAKEMGKKARGIVKDKYSIDVVLPVYIDLYERVINQ